MHWFSLDTPSQASLVRNLLLITLIIMQAAFKPLYTARAQPPLCRNCLPAAVAKCLLLGEPRPVENMVGMEN